VPLQRRKPGQCAWRTIDIEEHVVGTGGVVPGANLVRSGQFVRAQGRRPCSLQGNERARCAAEAADGEAAFQVLGVDLVDTDLSVPARRAVSDAHGPLTDRPVDCVHNESFKAYIDARHRHPATGCKRVAAGTINRDLAAARRNLNLSARLWRDEGSTLTWLAEAPLFQLLENRKGRKPYPITGPSRNYCSASLPCT
jgi:hypothetical protein